MRMLLIRKDGTVEDAGEYLGGNAYVKPAPTGRRCPACGVPEAGRQIFKRMGWTPDKVWILYYEDETIPPRKSKPGD